ncbi:MAG: hypothetical protein V4773_13305 [Verrucomicrobiota bacterium]
MKLIICLCLLMAGCAVAPRPLSEFPGWSVEELGNDRFRINLGPVKAEDAWYTSLVYAASVSLRRHYDAFVILEEDGNGESGTYFFKNLGYAGTGGMTRFKPGRYFTIICQAKMPKNDASWFDAAKTLKQKPFKVPAPAP